MPPSACDTHVPINTIDHAFFLIQGPFMIRANRLDNRDYKTFGIPKVAFRSGFDIHSHAKYNPSV